MKRPPRGDGAAVLLPGGNQRSGSGEHGAEQQAASGSCGKQWQEVCGDDTHLGVPSIEAPLRGHPLFFRGPNGERNKITQVRKYVVRLRFAQLPARSFAARLDSAGLGD